MQRMKIVNELLVPGVLAEVLHVEPESLLSVTADQEVPQIVGVEYRHQGQGERNRNAES